MNNLECVISVLERHREARRWADEAVARDLLAALGLDEKAETGEPVAEDEVRAAGYRAQLDAALNSPSTAAADQTPDVLVPHDHE
jgi:hypothetical protein